MEDTGTAKKGKAAYAEAQYGVVSILLCLEGPSISINSILLGL